MCIEPDRDRPEEPRGGWAEEVALLCTLVAGGAILLAQLWQMFRG